MVRWIWSKLEGSFKTANVSIFFLKSYDHYRSLLKFIYRETRSILEPYRSALSDIDNQISEQLEKIAAIKHKIHINDGKINNFMNIIGK